MNSVLSVNNLKKSYGSFEAVKGISFEVRENEIFGLIGPNGAGKSTTLKIIATILSLSGGEVKINEFRVGGQDQQIRRIISYLPEEAGAYKNLTGMQYLQFMASIYADNRIQQDEFVSRAVAIAGLGARLKDKVNTYSKGMTRKLLVARTVMINPKLAILDEPTSGLDITNALEVRKTIRDLSRQGMAVLLSSHNMLEIDLLCDRMAIIDEGVIKETGTAVELKEKYSAANLEEVFTKITK